MSSGPSGAGKRSHQVKRLCDIARADRFELQDRWLEVFGQRPPVQLSRELLILGLSYHKQSERSGGLGVSEWQALGHAGTDWIAGGHGAVDTRRATNLSRRGRRGEPPAKANTVASTRSRSQGQSDRRAPHPVRRSIKPGTRLLRDWQGQTHEVIADGDGQFIYCGQTYRSLSAVARLITGTRWSGPTFFGIATKTRADQSSGLDDA